VIACYIDHREQPRIGRTSMDESGCGQIRKGEISMNQNAPYLVSIRKQQVLEKELEQVKSTLDSLHIQLSEIVKVREWLIVRNLQVYIEIEEEIKVLQNRIGELEIIEGSLFSEWNHLREETNMGNLRHVVHFLYTEQGFSVDQFASQIQCSPDEILRLTRDGIVSEFLLDRICRYFNIAITKKFKRYIRI